MKIGNVNTLGAKRGGFVPQLSWTTIETGTFTGAVRMTEGDMKVSWGDGTSEIIADGADNLTHDYGGLSGDKKITVTFLKGYEDVTEFDINNTNSKGDLTNWNISSLTNLVKFRIFGNSFSGDLSGWDISGLTSLNRFYLQNNSFSGDLSGWDISGLTNLSDFYLFNNSFTKVPVLTSSVAWDGINILIRDSINILASNVSNHIIGLDDYDGNNGSLDASGTNGGSMTYADLSAAAQTAHDNLVNNKGWSITLDT
jgi:hypothetical protein